MKRRPIPQTDTYHSVYRKAVEVDPSSDRTCGIVAMSLVTSLPYGDCREALVKAGMDISQGVYMNEMWRALRSRGFTHYPIDFKDIVKRYPPSKRSKEQVTLRQVARFPSAWKGLPPCLMFVNAHVVAMMDGLVHDWSNSSSMRVQHIFAVLPKDDTFTLPWGKVLAPRSASGGARNQPLKGGA